MQIFLTVISGVVVYVAGQSILQFVLEPIKEFNKQRGDTSFLLLSYRAKITNAFNTDKKLQGEVKEMGAALVSTMMQIPLYDLFATCGIVPTRKNVFKAAQEINGISYGMGPVGNDEGSAQRNFKALQEIADALKIQTSFGA